MAGFLLSTWTWFPLRYFIPGGGSFILTNIKIRYDFFKILARFVW